ncbi:DUF3795 domain-containing protein [bacterium]|nr:DUF3795 domain-containing protein [bacterium]
METSIAYCGLSCRTCPIHIATLEENPENQSRMRIEIALLCREKYGMNLSEEEITDCDGCMTDGERLFPACRNCPIRTCARRKNLETCASCREYACGKLMRFFDTEPDAKARLDGLRKPAADP